MIELRVSFVDVYVLRLSHPGLEALVLRRAPGGRCPGSWEVVHGRIEQGEDPTEAGLRELREETGLEPVRFYNLSRAELFYRHRTREVAVIPAFAAFAAPESEVRLSPEHDGYEWLSLDAARNRVSWPRERRALYDVALLLSDGTAGALEDVLRIEGLGE